MPKVSGNSSRESRKGGREKEKGMGGGGGCNDYGNNDDENICIEDNVNNVYGTVMKLIKRKL